MSKCIIDINISSSTNIVDDISNDIEKLTTADDSDAASTKSEEMKEGASCEQKLEHNKTDDTSSNNDNVEHDIVQNNTGSLEASNICANCGKEGANNTCNKCKMTKYCNAVCKKVHKKKHKKDCEEHLRHAAMLQEVENKNAAELHDIELFKRPPRKEDCPICFLRLPTLNSGWRYKSCCGKVICSGCIHAVQIRDEEALCPFCRTPTPETNEEVIKRLWKREDAGDAHAMFSLGSHYSNGLHGLPQDQTKGLELYRRADELGDTISCYNIGAAYKFGYGVEIDEKKAVHYYELAAMKGDSHARHNLGAFEENMGSLDKALKHYMIATEGGVHESLKVIQKLYSRGHATKDDYVKALRAYQKYLLEVKSSQRDEAAAARADYKYIN